MWTPACGWAPRPDAFADAAEADTDAAEAADSTSGNVGVVRSAAAGGASSAGGGAGTGAGAGAGGGSWDKKLSNPFQTWFDEADVAFPRVKPQNDYDAR